MPRSRLPLPNLPLTVTVICWAYNFVALKHLYAEMTAPVVALVRFAVMVAILVVVCLVIGEPLRLPREHRGRIHFAGFLSMGVYMVLFLEGMRTTTASEGAIVLATGPVFTYLVACLVRQERFSTMALLASLVAFTGVALVIVGGSGAGAHGSMTGNLIVLAASVVWAVAVVVMKPVLTDVSPIRMLTLSMPAALPVLLIYGWKPLLATDFSAVSPIGWLMFAHIAVLSGVVAFAFFYRGIRQIGASRTTLYQFFVPPTTVLFAWFSLGERIHPLQAVGLAVTIAGVAASTKARAR